MNLQETKELITYVASSYPRFYRGITKSTFEKQAAVWADILGEYSYQAAIAGTKGFIATDSVGFPPSPGQIIAQIHREAPDAGLGGTEAWALVRKAVNVPWERMQESFDSLPAAVRKAVGSAASLNELAQMDIATFESVAQSNFLRMYKAAKERISGDERLPQSAFAIREQIATELEARRLARKLESGEPERVIRLPMTGPAQDAPERENVSGDSITDGMARLRRKLGA